MDVVNLLEISETFQQSGPFSLGVGELKGLSVLCQASKGK